MMNDLLAQTLRILDTNFHAMANALPQPRLTEWRNGYGWRYHERLIEQALILKLARYVSGLRAAHLLLESGFLQEQAVLQRTLDEINEDILFLAVAVTNGARTEQHDRFL